MAAKKRQLRIPGTEGEQIKELTDAANAYVSARDKRIKLTRKETEARVVLEGVMQKHNLTVYRDPDAVPPFTVTITEGKAKVKVTVEDGTKKDEDDAEGED